MPWTVADVDSKKKGLNSSQKKKWVKIANAALKRCQDKGGSNCDASAIRIANAAFSEEVEMTKEKLKMPQSALHFMDHECFAKAVVSDGDDGKPKLKMTAYSGKPIKNHWYWGTVVMDLGGMKFDKSSFPILENHMESRKIGFSNGKPVVTKDHKLEVDSDKVQFVDTEVSQEFIKLSKQGFPYESSIYGRPSSIERLEEGATAEVNGFNLKGPAAIWREWTFKEASVCVFGHDSNTRSEAFANTELELEMEVQTNKMVDVDVDQNKTTEKEVMSKMTLKELKEQNPEAFAALMEEAKGEVTTAVTTAVTEELTAKFTKEKEDLENKHSEEKTGLTDRILGLEKRDALRTEQELKHRAENIWASKLTESNIPEHLFAKVSAHVPYSKHVKEGVLDETAFGEAIDAEIKDWEDKGVTSSVLGMSVTRKTETGDEDSEAQKFSKENDDAVETLSKLAGIESSAA